MNELYIVIVIEQEKHIIKGGKGERGKGGKALIKIPQLDKMLLIINLAKPMLCHSLQCYHCLLNLFW